MTEKQCTRNQSDTYERSFASPYEYCQTIVRDSSFFVKHFLKRKNDTYEASTVEQKTLTNVLSGAGPNLFSVQKRIKSRMRFEMIMNDVCGRTVAIGENLL